jgi:hypothetical protein
MGRRKRDASPSAEQLGRLAMDVTLTIPDDLAARLRPLEDRLPEIIELGLREWLATPSGYAGLGSLLETLASLPSPEEILSLRPTDALQGRIEELLAKNRAGGLSEDERQEWERYEYLEHLVRLAKGRAIQQQAKR